MWSDGLVMIDWLIWVKRCLCAFAKLQEIFNGEYFEFSTEIFLGSKEGTLPP